MSSTDSPPAENPPTQPDQRSLSIEAVRDSVKSSEGLKRLAAMLGIKSVGRTMRTEDAAYERDIAVHERELLGGGAAGDTASGADAMDIMAAGNVTVNQPAQQQPKSALPSWLKTAVMLGLGALGGGAAIPVAAIVWNYFTRPKVEAPAEPTPTQPTDPTGQVLVPGALEIDVIPAGGEK